MPKVLDFSHAAFGKATVPTTPLCCDAPQTQKYYNSAEEIAKGLAAVRLVAEANYLCEFNLGAALRALADAAPYCDDAGFNCWTPDELCEIADKLEAER